jgi:hypothetical protein
VEVDVGIVEQDRGVLVPVGRLGHRHVELGIDDSLVVRLGVG